MENSALPQPLQQYLLLDPHALHIAKRDNLTVPAWLIANARQWESFCHDRQFRLKAIQIDHNIWSHSSNKPLKRQWAIKAMRDHDILGRYMTLEAAIEAARRIILGRAD